MKAKFYMAIAKLLRWTALTVLKVVPLLNGTKAKGRVHLWALGVINHSAKYLLKAVRAN